MGSINLPSKDQKIIESIVVTDMSNNNARIIMLHFNKYQHQFHFPRTKNVVFSIKIKSHFNKGYHVNVTGSDCYYEPLSTIYFANEQSLVSLGTLDSSPSNWFGLFIDGFEDGLIIEDTYIECISKASVETIYIVAIIFGILCITIAILFVIFYMFRWNKACLSLNTRSNTNVDIRLNASESDAINLYDIESGQCMQ